MSTPSPEEIERAKHENWLQMCLEQFHRSRGEEWANGISHLIGVIFGIVGLTLMCVFSAQVGTAKDVTGCAIFGTALILLYTFSMLYHVFTNFRAKRVFQILDHCGIFLLIAGSYTPCAPCPASVANEGFAPLCGAAAIPMAALKAPVAERRGAERRGRRIEGSRIEGAVRRGAAPSVVPSSGGGGVSVGRGGSVVPLSAVCLRSRPPDGPAGSRQPAPPGRICGRTRTLLRHTQQTYRMEIYHHYGMQITTV